jgi:hypothetical protein
LVKQLMGWMASRGFASRCSPDECRDLSTQHSGEKQHRSGGRRLPDPEWEVYYMDDFSDDLMTAEEFDRIKPTLTEQNLIGLSRYRTLAIERDGEMVAITNPFSGW